MATIQALRFHGKEDVRVESIASQYVPFPKYVPYIS